MTIVWSRTAIDDLKSLRAYIRQHNPRAATKAARTILARIESLAEFPAQGRAGRVPHTRELAIPGTAFLVVYSVAGDAVQIVAVLHAARKWPG